MLYLLILSHFAFAQDPLLEGLWRQDCLHQAIRQEHFQNSHVSLTESFYRDATCTQLALSFESHGDFQTQGKEIDFAFHKIFITVHDFSALLDFHTRKVCGIANWEQGIPQEVTGRYCEIYGNELGIQIPPAGQKRYGIYQIQKDLLFFGRLTPEKDATSPNKRPREFDGRFFKRILEK